MNINNTLISHGHLKTYDCSVSYVHLLPVEDASWEMTMERREGEENWYNQRTKKLVDCKICNDLTSGKSGVVD